MHTLSQTGFMPMTMKPIKKAGEMAREEMLQAKLIRRFDRERAIPLIAWIYQTRDIVTGAPSSEVTVIESNDTMQAFRAQVMTAVRYSEASEYYIAKQVTVGLQEEIQLLKYRYRSPMFRAWVAPIRHGRLQPFQEADLSRIYGETFSVESEKSA